MTQDKNIMAESSNSQKTIFELFRLRQQVSAIHRWSLGVQVMLGKSKYHLHVTTVSKTFVCEYKDSWTDIGFTRFPSSIDKESQQHCGSRLPGCVWRMAAVQLCSQAKGGMSKYINEF